LLKRHTGNRIEGSNPSVSATSEFTNIRRASLLRTLERRDPLGRFADGWTRLCQPRSPPRL